MSSDLHGLEDQGHNPDSAEQVDEVDQGPRRHGRGRALVGGVAITVGALLVSSTVGAAAEAPSRGGLELASSPGLRELPLGSVLAGPPAGVASVSWAGSHTPGVIVTDLTVPMTIDPLAPVRDPFGTYDAIQVVPTVDASGIPVRALAAYRSAADRFAGEQPGCGMTWSLLAGIGRVESRHGSIFGATVGADGAVLPAIIGVRLDGRGPFAEIRDTDGGALDGDLAYDRAVGPMQFLPGTWRSSGRDGDGDGVANPHDLDDAALAAASYLCAAGPVSDLAGSTRALFSYNRSREYGRQVLALAAGYAGLPTLGLPAPAAAPGPAALPVPVAVPVPVPATTAPRPAPAPAAPRPATAPAPARAPAPAPAPAPTLVPSAEPVASEPADPQPDPTVGDPASSPVPDLTPGG